MHTAYGPPDVLRLAEVDPPVPGHRDVLIKVFATTVTATECAMRRGEPRWGAGDPRAHPAAQRMRRLGMELAGDRRRGRRAGATLPARRPVSRLHRLRARRLRRIQTHAGAAVTGDHTRRTRPSYEAAAAAVDGATPPRCSSCRDKATVRSRASGCRSSARPAASAPTRSSWPSASARR